MLRSPFDAAFTLINALFLKHAFNAVEQNDISRLMLVCFLFGVACFGLFLYNGTIWTIFVAFNMRMEGVLRLKLFHKIASFSYQRIEATPQGEWLTRLNVDAEMPFNRPIHLPHAACAVVNIIVSGIILWTMNPAIFGMVMLFVAPHIIFSQLFIGRVMPQLNKKSLEAMAINTGDMATLITCADIAALYNSHDYFMNHFEESSLELFCRNMKIHMRNAIGASIIPLFGLGGYLALLVVSSRWIASGHFTFGDLTAVFQYRGGVLAGSLMLINCLISIQGSVASMRRVNDTMCEQGGH